MSRFRRAVRKLLMRGFAACALGLALPAGLALAPSAALAQAAQGPHHNSIAIIIGNQKYRHTTPVIYAHNDARAMERYLIDRLGFRRGNVMVKLDLGREQMETLFGEPDRADGEIMDRLLDRRIENRGDVFVFYSGHGVPDPDAIQDDGRRAFLLPTDVRQDRIAAAAFPIERLHRKLDLIRGHLPPERKIVLMMDACFSGRTPVARGTPNSDGPDASLFKFSRGSFSVRAEQPTAEVIRLVAATGDQVAYWDEQRKLGLFTSLFLRGVGGEADGQEFGNGDRVVTGDELSRFLEERVPAEARLRHQRTQRPTLDGIERFAWTLPRAGQIAAPAVVPVPVRAQPASLPATPVQPVAPAAPQPAPAPAPAAALPAAAEPVRAEPPKPAAPVVAPTPPAPAVAARPVAPTPAPAAAPVTPPRPAAAPAPARPTPPARAARPAAEEEEAKPAPRKRTARVAPRPVVEDDEEEVRPRPRRQRPAAQAPRPRPPARAAAPRPAEPSGGCRVVNGVRFCG